MPSTEVEKIVSGGQTGADRAALDWAISRNIPHGGWCPKGRLAEDGTIPSHYDLQEMPTKDYPRRTEQNVIDSDGTVIFTIKPLLAGGSMETAEFVVKHRKPLLHVHSHEPDAGKKLADFVAQHQIKTLNVAGPRASGGPTIGEFVTKVLDAAFS
ncbi:MAG: hypothetical protein QOE70_6309 [Chthoniobacter sp.]|jgi:hypothetical protein|nr:hypothetical protein [Chthoniobacter sp.]